MISSATKMRQNQIAKKASAISLERIAQAKRVWLYGHTDTRGAAAAPVNEEIGGCDKILCAKVTPRGLRLVQYRSKYGIVHVCYQCLAGTVRGNGHVWEMNPHITTPLDEIHTDWFLNSELL